MKKYDLAAEIKEALERSKELNLSFKNAGYPETYPGDENTTSNFLDSQINSLSSLAHITYFYRSYETKNFLLKWFFVKLRKYLFREIDFRYGLILANQERANLQIVEALKVLGKSVNDLQLQLSENGRQIDAFRNDLQSQLTSMEKQMSAFKEVYYSELHELQYPSLDIDYFKFENKFRGPELEICWRLEKYLKYFENCRNVLDVGCGRGEFLDICRDKSIQAVGLDMNEQFCAYVKHKGHEVVCDDVFHYFESIEDESLDGVFAAHILEHFTERDLLKVIKLFYSKLKNGSYCVIETPNAESLIAMASAFYVDFTHKKPLHPLGLEFIFQEQGFSEVKIQRIDYREYDGMDETRKLIMAPEDFAIIARK